MPVQIKFADTPAEVDRCYPVIAQLRPHLTADSFPATVARLAAGTGFRLAYLTDGEGDGEVKAVAGCRMAEWLPLGKYMEIEDLVTDSSARSKGYGEQLFQWLLAEAQREGCQQMRLVSGVQRVDAHRFYERLGMRFEAKFFSLPIQQPGA